MLIEDKKTLEVINRYGIEIISQPEMERDSFISAEPLLNFLIAMHSNVEHAGKLVNLVYIANNQHFAYFLISNTPGTDNIEYYPVFSQEEYTGSGHLVLPTADMLSIAMLWQAKRLYWIQRSIEVEDGQGIIRLINDDQSTVLIIEKPVAMNWPDCHGSIGEYYAVSSFPAQQRKTLTRQLDEVLISGSNSKVLESIEAFLKLFENGRYNIHLGKIRDEDVDDIIFDRDSKTWPEDKEWFAANFFPYHNGWIYLATRTEDSINIDRVAFYEDLIRKGLRPRVIVYIHYLNHDYSSSNYYIIDGHHKFKAYNNLKIDPAAVYISKDCYEEKMSNEMLSAALSILNPNAFRHYLRNYSEENLSALLPIEVTNELDKLLRTEKDIDTGIIANIRKAYTDPLIKKWAEERLSILQTNKYIGKGFYLSFLQTLPQNSYTVWSHFPINSNKDFEHWKEVFLEGKPLNKEMEDKLRHRAAQLSESYNRYPPDNPSTYHSSHDTESYFNGREILIVIAILVLLIQLIIRGC
ncbi:hypothetical protein [Pedobacter mendelii]|uniref:Uncharacterized protein n=1 Tax=Pedobacter mendelii TaxID=1908240 RepID=A0ABQ2BDU6_9SPHI|nr:hypothetical protein [Pedobacter mendelii]GGI23868.1 hypothetical protein GCM10008119_09810 [Pedobacter mendelii]